MWSSLIVHILDFVIVFSINTEVEIKGTTLSLFIIWSVIYQFLK